MNMDEKKTSPASSPYGSDREHFENKPGRIVDPESISRDKLNALFENPLGGISYEQLMKDVEQFCQRWELMDHLDVFKKGALVAQNPHKVQGMDILTDADKNFLEREHTHKWSQPFTLYWLVSEWCPSSRFYSPR